MNDAALCQTIIAPKTRSNITENIGREDSFRKGHFSSTALASAGNYETKISMTVLNALAQIFSRLPAGGERPTEALAAIVGVAVVAWAGAFVVIAWVLAPRNREKSTLNRWSDNYLIAAGALDLLQTSFFGGLVAMLASPSWLRLVAFACLVFYGWRLWRLVNEESNEIKERVALSSLVIAETLCVSGYLLIAIFPLYILACCFILTTLFGGYQMLLWLLRNAYQDAADESS